MAEFEIRARTVLEPVANALESDGYSLTVEDAQGGALRIRIAATPEACEDCLAPKAVIQPMIEQLLEADGLPTAGLKLAYPNE